MLKKFFTCLSAILMAFYASGQNDSTYLLNADTISSKQHVVNHHQLYKIKPAVDIPIAAAGTAWSLYAFSKIYVKPPSSEEKILSLKKEDINSFDRWAVRPYNGTLDKISYYPFYAALPYPLIFFAADDAMRKDYWKLSFLYWEAMAITGIFGEGATYSVDKYRPYAYSSGTQMDKRTDGLSKNSFYAGHVQVVAVPTFFVAKVYADYHPDSPTRWVYYGIAALATATTSYMRLEAGEHFPSDILLGAAMGTLTGILVPQFHKHSLLKNQDMSIFPYLNGETYGIAMLMEVK